MRVAFFSTSLAFSGGRLAMLRHADELARRGHDVSFRVEEVEPETGWVESRVPVRRFSRSNVAGLPHADLCVFDRVRLARPLVNAGRGRVVHLCQGFEGTDTELRLRRAWDERGLFGLPNVLRMWRRRRAIDAAYRLPTAKVVTHRHLGDLLLRRYGQPSDLVPYGLPDGVFTPPAARDGPARTVLIVGPTDVGWKRVLDGVSAVGLLKRRRPGVRLVRVAQHPMRDAEHAFGVADEYHTMLTPPQMADLYRRADVLLCPSDETEGFGLPVLEAMACGLPCAVTDIPAFRSFDRPDDYARFVPVGDVGGMAAALEWLMDSPHELRRLTARGLEVAAGYAMRRSHDLMEATLTKLAGGAARAAA